MMIEIETPRAPHAPLRRHNVEGWSVIDTLLIALIVGGGLLYTLLHVNLANPPAEDAAMLLRYARQLAAGAGIVWNSGDAPVDGGTDALLIPLLALILKTGAPLAAATRVVTIPAHVLTTVVIYVAIRRITQGRAPRLLALVCAAFVLVGPGLQYIEAHFGTTLFAFLACLCWYRAYLLLETSASGRDESVFALVALLLGLARPEGVLLAALMLLAVLWLQPRDRRGMTLRAFALIVGVGGALYFCWHWAYFGAPLPNPFYRKGGGVLYPASLRAAIGNVLIMCFFPLLAWAVSWAACPLSRRVLALIPPLVGFSVIWVLLSNEMNYAMRFQYALVPIVTLTAGVGLSDVWTTRVPSWSRRLPPLRAVLLSLGGAAAILALLFESALSTPRRSGYVELYRVALGLASLNAGHETLLTTEAGLLPLYSDWRSVDAWGLNDRWIAHHGAITARYIAAVNPRLIVVHPMAAPDANFTAVQALAWRRMTLTLQGYARSHGYREVGSCGVGSRPFCYYVQVGRGDTRDLIATIRRALGETA